MITDKPGCGRDIQFLRPPEPCGYIKIADGYKVALNKYPNWFHRMMVRLILGWRFERVEKEKR